MATRKRILTPRELEKILFREGFVLDRSKGSHRIYTHPEKKHRVVVPFHRKALPKGTVHSILKQAGLR